MALPIFRTRRKTLLGGSCLITALSYSNRALPWHSVEKASTGLSSQLTVPMVSSKFSSSPLSMKSERSSSSLADATYFFTYSFTCPSGLSRMIDELFSESWVPIAQLPACRIEGWGPYRH